MKKNLLIAVCCFLSTPFIWAQAPKYVLFEHFTNTRCGVCGGTNPTFYQNVNINTNTKLHHISMHSSIPYSACVFYQANPAPQDERANYFNIPGTPRVVINGITTLGAGSITAAMIDNAYCATCSPVAIKVSESGSGTRQALIEIITLGTRPSGNYRLLAAVVEKTVNYSAPNSETVHHNVFRQFLTPTVGVPFTLPTQGGTASLTVYNYTLNAAWLANEVYVVAWLYDETTKSVLNSGTKFDPVVVPLELIAWKGVVKEAKNRLEWTTASEINTDYFEIQRSVDSKNFEIIGRVKAAGASTSPLTYTFDEGKNVQNTQYYRLKMVDLDGSFTISDVITLVGKNKNGRLTLYPSPTNQTLYITFQAKNTGSEWLILDALGKVVKQSLASSKAQNTDLSRDNREGVFSEMVDVSALPNGLYSVQLIQQNEVSVARFVKSN
jgi:Outer membrane protein Omp28/Secretion system C-terminal sorting domain